MKSFNIAKYKNDIELSKEVWRVKKQITENYQLNGASSLNVGLTNQSKKRCPQCLNEKTEITTYKDTNLLNKEQEMVSKCRHEEVHACVI